MEQPKFKLGDYVEKFEGEARYSGWIVSVYTTKQGGIRYVVQVDPQGFQMIVTEKMIRTIPEWSLLVRHRM